MALSILSNAAANKASFSLTKNSAKLQESLTRLSSGKKITAPADDAGGLAVSMKLTSAIGRNKSVISNIQNALSFAEVQDGALQSSATILNRMSELKSMSLDVIKSDADIANYNVEFKALQEQLFSIANEKFNGVSLFADKTSTAVFGDAANVVNVTIFTSDQGGSGAVVSLQKAQLLSALTFTSTTNIANVSFANAGANVKSLASDSTGTRAKVEIADLSIGFFTKALENIATVRATNAAGMARLQLAEDHARLTKANLEAANSRIMDVDVAEESTRFAKYNILTQASAAMLSQANQSSSTALLLL
jgi:flagellin